MYTYEPLCKIYTTIYMHVCPYLYICICVHVYIYYIYNVCTRFFGRYLSSHIMINTWFKYIVILCPDNSDNCPARSICGRDGSWHHFYLSVLNILHEECSNKATWPQHKKCVPCHSTLPFTSFEGTGIRDSCINSRNIPIFWCESIARPFLYILHSPLLYLKAAFSGTL